MLEHVRKRSQEKSQDIGRARVVRVGSECTVCRSKDVVGYLVVSNVETSKDSPHDEISLKNRVVPIPKNHHQSSSLSHEKVSVV